VGSVYIPAIFVLNKIDTITIEELDLLSRVPHYVPISAKDEWNFDDLLEKIWTYLDMLRMYGICSGCSMVVIDGLMHSYAWVHFKIHQAQGSNSRLRCASCAATRYVAP